MHAGKARLQVRRTGARLDEGDTGMNGHITGFGIEGVMTDTHTRYVGNGIILARGARSDGDAQIA
ncbi:hypothetical protein D3C80_1792720 [compost metagenome]